MVYNVAVLVFVVCTLVSGDNITVLVREKRQGLLGDLLKPIVNIGRKPDPVRVPLQNQLSHGSPIQDSNTIESFLRRVEGNKHLIPGPLSRSGSVLNPITSTLRAFQPCVTPLSVPGHCRYVRQCVLPSFLNNFDLFLNYVCIIESQFMGVCCPDQFFTQALPSLLPGRLPKPAIPLVSDLLSLGGVGQGSSHERPTNFRPQPTNPEYPPAVPQGMPQHGTGHNDPVQTLHGNRPFGGTSDHTATGPQREPFEQGGLPHGSGSHFGNSGHVQEPTHAHDGQSGHTGTSGHGSRPPYVNDQQSSGGHIGGGANVVNPQYPHDHTGHGGHAGSGVHGSRPTHVEDQYGPGSGVHGSRPAHVGDQYGPGSGIHGSRPTHVDDQHGSGSAGHTGGIGQPIDNSGYNKVPGRPDDDGSIEGHRGTTTRRPHNAGVNTSRPVLTTVPSTRRPAYTTTRSTRRPAVTPRPNNSGHRDDSDDSESAPIVFPDDSVPDQEITPKVTIPKGLSSINQSCGLNFKTRIVGGQVAKPDQWTWMAALLRRSNDDQFCGGALISDRYVLTAAHCTQGLRPQNITVRLGEYDFKQETSSRRPRDFNVSRIRQHPDFKKDTYHNDIALLRLSRRVRFTEHIRPICLPRSSEETFFGRSGTVVGWGTLSFGGPSSAILREVALPIWNNTECKSKFTQSITDVFLCAGTRDGGQDACQGDSGGPLMLEAENSQWTLVGVVSWGIQCAQAGLPGVYTRVSNFLDWIYENAVD